MTSHEPTEAPWRELARQASEEYDTHKLLELTRKVIEKYDEEKRREN
jgi:hypothetical protein